MSEHNNTNNMTTRAAIAGVGCLIIAAVSTLSSANLESYSRNQLTNDEVNTIIDTTKLAFEAAEKEILKMVPDDKPDGPHPDVNKCVCRGTGKITHGDGHQTECPYHAEETPPNPKPEPEPEPEKCTGCQCDTQNTYCNCIATYGSCSCQKTKHSGMSLAGSAGRILNCGLR